MTRLNDVHLKIRPPPGKEIAEQEANTQIQLNELTTKLRAIHDLARTEGWKLFLEDLDNERIQLLGELTKCSDPTTLAKVTGTLLCVERFKNFIYYMSQELEQAARNMQED